ncbi:MAG: OadG family protein [Oscillibacter sp.]|uniref:OadG family protein n=1 Tax=Oscillibacter sp. MSJ-31 TaxID=2841526 RepID=UPI001C11CB2D|nr:OadG family protein [Oscillibacter sp. MSJ-31]MDD7509408.1 OadG family protein [Oscillibacter sp.]MDY5711509.1 OadG family protein [Oscillospiraceae bacterium]MBU5457093.1 OadG family protein [Oscillibacter sp. MSJ-31]MDY5805040.1 OadG family protein [Oscillospiraceae bacterium]MDY6098097.1 OadG family protein [Oscillospiraceae bacterium]
MYSPLFVTLMGIGTVFFGLVCIIVLTTIMGAVLKSNAKPAPAPAAAPKAAAPAAPAVNTAKEQEILAAVIAAVTEDLGPSASRMQITSINKI